jgi:nicotinate-nucleotide adenylyltransferase
MVQKIGIFGGTFDPPHIAHLVLASEACAQLALDRLLWVLTPLPPHKLNQDISGTEHRLEMLRLAIAADPHFEISTVEFDRPGPQYAVDTVKEIGNLNPSAELFYLIGEDSLRDIITWHEPAALLLNCHFLGVMKRPGVMLNLSVLENFLPGLEGKIRWIDAPQLDIASHDIRSRIREKRPWRYFLTDEVYQYIDTHNLYE